MVDARKCLVLGLLMAIFFLAACGGGGGGGETGPGDNEGGASSGDIVSFSENALAFSYSLGAPTPSSQTVNVWFGGAYILAVGYPPGVEEADWLSVSQVDSSDDRSPIEMRFALNTHSLTAGTHKTTIRFVAKSIDHSVMEYRDLPVTCTVYNQIGLDKTELDFSYTDSSLTQPDSQAVSIYGDALNWTARADQDWVVLSPNSGTAPSSLNVGVDPAGLTVGSHTATVDVTNSASGASEQIEVRLAVEPHKLFVGDNGVAFASFPTAASVLSHTVKVSEDAGVATAWTASSDAAWLNVTPDGVTDGLLALTADPAGLAPDTIHYATVTVSSSDPTIANTENVSVGLYVSAADPSATELSYSGKAIVADPIRPYVYVADSSVAATDGEDAIDIFNIYNGDHVGSISAGRDLAAMTISSDGEMLFAADKSDGTIIPIQLDTLTPGSKWAAEDLDRYVRLEYTRFNGAGVVLTSGRQVFDASNGALAATIDYPFNYYTVMAPCTNNNSFYGTQTKLSGYLFDLSRFVGHYSTVKNSFTVRRTHSGSYPSVAATDIAVDADGSKVYLTATSLLAFDFDGNTISDYSTLEGPGVSTVEVGPTSKVYAGLYTSTNDPIGEVDSVSLTADGAPGDNYSFNGALDEGQQKVSGDGLRMITLSTGTLSKRYLSLTAITP